MPSSVSWEVPVVAAGDGCAQEAVSDNPFNGKASLKLRHVQMRRPLCLCASACTLRVGGCLPSHGRQTEFRTSRVQNVTSSERQPMREETVPNVPNWSMIKRSSHACQRSTVETAETRQGTTTRKGPKSDWRWAAVQGEDSGLLVFFGL